MGGNREDGRGRSLTTVGNVVFGADREIAWWVSKRIPGFTASPKGRALGVIKGGAVVAGVVYDNWNGCHVEASIAAEPGSGWASRATLHALFFYPFVTLDCQAITVAVAETNLPSLNLALKMGFEAEALIRFAAHDGSTLIVLKQFRDTCRWIGQHGQRQQRTGTPGPL